MALTKCKECGHAVSTTAAACPNCGAPPSDPETTDGKVLSPEKESGKKKSFDLNHLTLKSGGVVLLVFIGLVVLVIIMLDSQSSDKGDRKASIANLKAEVSFTGAKFVIINNDASDWTNVKMEINGGLVRGGYTLEHPIMKAGQTYTVGVMQFAKSDGMRFNPNTMKVNKFNIYSRDYRGIAKGLWAGGWK